MINTNIVNSDTVKQLIIFNLDKLLSVKNQVEGGIEGIKHRRSTKECLDPYLCLLEYLDSDKTDLPFNRNYLLPPTLKNPIEWLNQQLADDNIECIAHAYDPNVIRSDNNYQGYDIFIGDKNSYCINISTTINLSKKYIDTWMKSIIAGVFEDGKPKGLCQARLTDVYDFAGTHHTMVGYFKDEVMIAGIFVECFGHICIHIGKQNYECRDSAENINYLGKPIYEYPTMFVRDIETLY